MNDYEQMQHAREVLAQVSAPRDPRVCGVSLNDFSKLDLIVMVSFVATFPRVAVDKRFTRGRGRS